MQEGRVLMGGTSSESLDDRDLTDVMLGIAEIALYRRSHLAVGGPIRVLVVHFNRR